MIADVAPDRFAARLAAVGLEPLTARAVETLQVNVGKVCNQACRHCHVDAGPHRTEAMDAATARKVLDVLARYPEIRTLDITGGAPELNPHFRTLATGARALGRHVIDRCNLTILEQPGQEDLAEFLAIHGIEIIASLPCYTAENVDRQRGNGVFAASIRGLQRLNALGYGQPGSGLALNLVYNPLGPSLPPAQAALEADYRRRLAADFSIDFSALYTLANMPIHRFREDLARQGKLEAYIDKLDTNFNSAAVPEVMCRSLVSVNWDGRLSDCDFNQMLEMGIDGPATLDNFDAVLLATRRVRTGTHCLACTAGAGSSCGGALLR